MKRIIFALVISTLIGCSHNADLPQGPYTMEQIYDGASDKTPPPTSDHTADEMASHAPLPLRPIQSGERDLAGFTREAATEITTRFPRVPNPTLVMYVYPHLAGELPVPGYTTTFPLWESAPYALPGETLTTETLTTEALAR
jgi:conjugative transfer region lipoprotein (TIGR03751 family)